MGRGASLAGLVVVAGGAAAGKSLLIADDAWSVAAQVGLLGSAVVASGVVLARGAEPGDRLATVRRELGLVAPWRDGGAVLAIAGPLALSGAVTAIGLAIRAEPAHVDAGEMADLVLLVAGAEELIYRGAVLALARQALTPVPAELVTAVAFGLSHLGNAGSWTRVVGPIVGGLIFSGLRHRSGSLAGSVAGHLATNLPGRVLSG